MTGDWRDYRRAIWTLMLGVAVTALVTPYALVLFVGGAVGLALAVPKRRRAFYAAQSRQLDDGGSPPPGPPASGRGAGRRAGARGPRA